MTELYESIGKRLRPEMVAEILLETNGFSEAERQVLATAARFAHRWGGWTSMSEDFARPDDAGTQVEAVRGLLRADGPTADPADAQSVWDFLFWAGESIQWTPERADFKADRLNRQARVEAGIDISKRQYNRRFRALGRLADKSRRLERETLKQRLILIGRSGFASEIPRSRFEADPAAAAFVAYYTARRNARRAFSLSGRDNPYDIVADMLFRRLGEATDWAMVAMAYPTAEVLARLDGKDLGELLGRWSSVMAETAGILRDVWGDGKLVERKTMIVRRGFDSSTWNMVAQAYNAARAGWINILAASGSVGLLDSYCPPKAMRVMAADLAYWHRVTGGDTHPDTKVAALLPLPWLVISGKRRCGRTKVEEACKVVGVDPAASGWTAPRATGKVASFKPTPELVHGIAVADPLWAGLLRKAGAFSGKEFKPDLLPAEIPEGVVVGPLADFRLPPEPEE